MNSPEKNQKPIKIVGIVPARMASSRLPGKVLADIGGIPMVGHCYFRTRMCRLIDEVYVATCDKEVVDYIESIGGKAIMTADVHERAMDRTAEAVAKIEKDTGEKIDIVVQMQGDEPMVTAEMLEPAIRQVIEDTSINMLNLLARITNPRDLEIPATLKVVVDKNNDMVYLSRNLIPYDTKKYKGEVPRLKTLGVHIFRKDFLNNFTNMEPTILEMIEACDLIRILENGYKIKTLVTDKVTYAVDTQEDLELVREEMAKDPLIKTYVKSK